MNIIIIKGRLARNPELRRTQSDIPVASFCVAVDRRFTPKGEERQADFIDCVAWRQAAEFVDKYFSKGKEILVRGSLQSRRWEDKEGRKRISWEIIAENVEFCGAKSDAAPASAAPDRSERSGGVPVSAGNCEPPAYQGGDAGFHELTGDDDELPF